MLVLTLVHGTQVGDVRALGVVRRKPRRDGSGRGRIAGLEAGVNGHSWLIGSGRLAHKAKKPESW
ncbi:hypothetical protein D3C87_2041440 [compost metagenome]